MPQATGLGMSMVQERDADKDPIGRVDQHLAQKIMAQPQSGVAHSRGGALEIGTAERPDQPVAQILALKQDEDDEEKHHTSRDERRQYSARNGTVQVEPRRLGRAYLHGDRRLRRLDRKFSHLRRGGRCRRLLELGLQLLQDVTRFPQHLRFGRRLP